MKKYISILLAAVLCSSILAGCGGSGKSDQQAAGETQEKAVQSEKTAETGAKEDAAQADAAQDSAQAAADTAANSGAYLIYVLDAETMEPIPGVRVQFCSDSLCKMGKTDESGVAMFDSEPGTYTVHMMKAPDGYVKSEEEITLDKDNRKATYLLAKEGAAAEAADNKSAESDSVMDFPLTGFTFDAPEEFNHLMGEIRSKDIGEIGDTGVVLGFVAYQAKTTAEAEEYFNTLGVTTVEEMTDEVYEKMEKFYEDTPTIWLFRVMGVKGDQDLEELKKQMFNFPVSVFDELGTAGDYKFYYVVLDNEEYFEELRNTNYPKDRLDVAYKLWQEAATTSNFKDRVTIKEPISLYPSVENGAAVSFETQDLDGNPVTSQELFAGHKITMINIWATWCINCKSEMTELEELNKEWAEKGCQIIGICDDADEEEMIPTAKKILEEKGVTFPNVRTTDVIRDLLPSVGLPTTYFVDSEGKILGKPIVGKNVEQYKETLQQLLSEME